MPAPSDPKKPPLGATPKPSSPTPAAPARTASGDRLPARTASGDRLPAAPAGEPAPPAAPSAPVPSFTPGSLEPKVRFGLLRAPGPSDQVLEVAAHVTAGAPSVTVGAEALEALRGPLRARLDSTLPPGEKPAGVNVYEMDLAIARFHDRGYAVARVGPGVDLTDSMESTATGLAKAAWKLPRPC